MKNDRTLFLKWTLSQMKKQWTGFSKVNKKVYKRIIRRTEGFSISRKNDVSVYGLCTVVICIVVFNQFYFLFFSHGEI
jgi:t-SNARE complex subunit (syntaxin)